MTLDLKQKMGELEGLIVKIMGTVFKIQMMSWF
jgi:hypothetical protein